MHRFLIPIFILLAAPAAAFALFMQQAGVPIERVVKNLEARLEADPEDAAAAYNLARAHYFAFAMNTGKIAAMESKEGELTVAGQHMQWGARGEKELPKAKAQEHAARAAEMFRQALKLKPKNALYHLGYASLQLQYVERAKKNEWTEHPEPLAALTLETARDSAYAAFENSKAEIEKLEMIGPVPPVGFEAVDLFLKLCDQTKVAEDNERRQEALAAKTKLSKLPRAITPILIANSAGARLPQLLDSEIEVEFDLDGDDEVETWPWVRPETGILVWDPERSGKITSGRQLFGSATWWMFFEDGYQAMDALDDNRDGRLAGGELPGLAIWRDRNSNGVSDPGEVTPVEEIGLEWLVTRPDKPTNGVLQARRGASIRGNTLPTFDWIVAPVSD